MDKEYIILFMTILLLLVISIKKGSLSIVVVKKVIKNFCEVAA